MKKTIKIILVILSIFLGIVLVVFYRMEWIPTYETIFNEIEVTKTLDLKKVGEVANFDVDIPKKKGYTFSLDYLRNLEEHMKEREELEKNLKPGERMDNDMTLFYKALGRNNSYEITKEGAKIVLKLTITPLFELKDDYIYWNFEEFPASRYTKKSNKPFEITIDLSQTLSHSGRHSDIHDRKKYFGREKEMFHLLLPKGKYNIKVENLKDVPNIEKIITVLIIYIQKRKA